MHKVTISQSTCRTDETLRLDTILFLVFLVLTASPFGEMKEVYWHVLQRRVAQLFLIEVISSIKSEQTVCSN